VEDRTKNIEIRTLEKTDHSLKQEGKEQKEQEYFRNKNTLSFKPVVFILFCSRTPRYFLFNFVPRKLFVYNSSYTQPIIYILNKLHASNNTRKHKVSKTRKNIV
jgi:hypothetical protein